MNKRIVGHHYMWMGYYFNDEIDMEMTMAMLHPLEAPSTVESVRDYIAFVKEQIPPRSATLEEIAKFGNECQPNCFNLPAIVFADPGKKSKKSKKCDK